MIISLFMDETPLICGSGHNPGGHGGAAGRTGAVRQVTLSRGDARGRGKRTCEHQENAGNVHVCVRYRRKSRGRAPGAPSW
jgi:hypothetical protein